jgi:large subunit ribosomal protein L15
MRLNTLRPASGSKSKAKRVGRGIGCGFGKTCGRGHKGQTSRSGGYHKVGFEGGQMPLQRRLPKVGFTSRVSRGTEQVRLGSLGRVEGDVVDLAALKAAHVVSRSTKRARVFLSGSIERALTVRGITVSRGARTAIEQAGGKVE